MVLECATDAADCPLVEVDAEARIVWTNRQAAERLPGHPGLVVAAGRLRARVREHDAALREAVRRAHGELRSHRPLNVVPRQAWPVALGEDDAASPLFCWVLLEDGRALVSFDDARTVARRVATAEEVFGLSPAQTRLARLVVDGLDLAVAAAELGVSVNTLRTQMQRIFDRHSEPGGAGPGPAERRGAAEVAVRPDTNRRGSPRSGRRTP